MIRKYLRSLFAHRMIPQRRPSKPTFERLEDRLAPATLPPGYTESLLAAGLEGATAMEVAPDGRIFVAEQVGRLRVIRDGALLPSPFVTIPEVDVEVERGLLGIALDPDFSTQPYVYVFYNRVLGSEVWALVSRFTANGDEAVPGSEVFLMVVPSGPWHVAGAIHFGPDGKLYIALGDMSQDFPSQFLDGPNGKILRINKDGTIPTDNPFYSQTTEFSRSIWALGLRNPYTFAFQPGTGRMFINDVGNSAWEEINDGIAGSNYGWPYSEGNRLPSDPATDIGTYRDPFYTYAHALGACAITGGVFYNPASSQFPADFVGDYFFTDFCAGWIRRLDTVTRTVSDFAAGLTFPVDLEVGQDGSLYYLMRGSGGQGGQVWRVQLPSSQVSPSVTQHPSNQLAPVGGSATFTVFATGSTPLLYQWQRNGADIPGAISAAYSTLPLTLADNGASFRVVISNAVGTVTSNAATLTVTTNQPPVATILTPSVGAFYAAGDIISYSGSGSDLEDGTLGASALTWRIDFHHDDHTHPFMPPTSGMTGGSFTISADGETAANVSYRITLTATDSLGQTNTVFRDVLPRTVNLTLQTSPAGLRVTLDGQSQTGPHAVVGVVGMSRTIGVLTPQTVGGITYDFESWSDGGAATHAISTPATDTTFTAVFRPRTTVPPPTITGQPANQSVAVGTPATFSVTAAGGEPLTYQWQRDGSNIAGATASTYTLNPATLADDGASFRVVVTNAAASVTSSAATLTVRPNQAPIAVNDVATTLEDTHVDIAVLANDSDPDGHPLRVASVASPTDGTAVVVGGLVRYTPRANFHGIDSFTYTVSDGQGGTATATARITIMPVNDVPTSSADLLVGRALETGDIWVANSTGAAFTAQVWGHLDRTVNWSDVHTGFFNDDALEDLVARDPATGQWWVLQADGASFVNRLWGSWQAGVNYVDVQAGDFNGDGRDDLAGRAAATGGWLVALSNGANFDTQGWGAWSPKARWLDVQVGDFNGDGRDDLAGRNARKGRWQVAQSTGSSFATRIWTTWSTKTRWNDVRVGDFNGDGRDDLLGRSQRRGSWRVALSTGTAFSNQGWSVWSRSVAWADVRVADFNGDGRDDVAGRNLSDGGWQVALSASRVFVNQAWGAWTPALTWLDADVGDFNNDGRPDIAGRAAETGQWLVALSDGGSFVHQVWGGWSPMLDWQDVHALSRRR